MPLEKCLFKSFVCFWIGFCGFVTELKVFFMYILGTRFLADMHDLHITLPLMGVFLLSWVFYSTKNLIGSQLMSFFFCCLVLLVSWLRNRCLIWHYRGLHPCFLPGFAFIILTLTFRSVIHLHFVFGVVQEWDNGRTFIPLHMNIQLSKPRWKGSLSLANCSLQHPCWKSLGDKCIGLFLSSGFCSVGFCVYFCVSPYWVTGLLWLRIVCLKLFSPSAPTVLFSFKMVFTAPHSVIRLSFSAVNRYSVQSVQQFGDYCRLNNFEFFGLETWYILLFIYVFCDFFQWYFVDWLQCISLALLLLNTLLILFLLLH